MNNYAVMPKTDYINACDVIREKTETTDNIKSGELGNKINDVYNAGGASVLKNSQYMHPTVSGEIIRIDDVANVPHKVAVGKRSKNLIPYPYVETTKTKNGVTFTDNGDGTITLNGTATANTQFSLKYYFDVPTDSAYTLSGCPAGGSYSTYFLALNYYDNGTATTGLRDLGSGATKTFQKNTRVETYMYIYSGTAFSNLTFKPQLELGTTATSYTPYVENLEAVKIRKYGKNLVSFSPTAVGRTDIVMTLKEDGECIFNGTATSDYAVIVTLNLPRNTYTFSINNNVGIGTGTYTDTPYIALRGKSSDGMPWFTSAKLNNPNTTAVLYKTSPVFDTTNLYDVIFVIPKGVTVNNFSIKPQLELGNVATEYEPYQEPQILETNEGDSLYPTMTLYSDNQGVVLDCQYLRDIDKYIDKSFN